MMMITPLILFLVQMARSTAFVPNPAFFNQKLSPSQSTTGNKLSLNAVDTTKDDIFAPLKRMFNFDNGQTTQVEVNEYDEKILEAKNLLEKAVETKSEDPELVVDALTNLERLMREKCKAEPSHADEILENLCGEWRLIFTTGTDKSKSVNYFPIKAVQSFDTKSDPMKIENGIYLGDFNLIKFMGDFEFDLIKRKVEFDFDQIIALGLKIDLPKGKAAELGAASGLGSKNNKDLIAKQKKKPFFNWISADENIATARGGGGGLALWKRVV